MEEYRPLPMFKCEQIEGSRLSKEWIEWKRALQFYFDAAGIIDQKTMRAKMLHFGGPQLQKVFGSLEGTEEFSMVLLDTPWYDKAIECLDGYFNPYRQDVLERHKLRKLKQLQNERFAHFILRVREQLSYCGFDKHPAEIRKVLEEIMMIDVIVEGCASPELRRKILAKDYTLTEIEALGESIESVRMQERELAGAKLEQSEVGVNKITLGKRNYNRGEIQQMSASERPVVGNCYACGKPGHYANAAHCKAKGKVCRKCKITGHFENVCRKKSAGKGPRTSASVKRIRTVEDVSSPGIATEENMVDVEKKVYYTFYGGNTTNVLTVKIGGVKLDMLVDSGSDANLITGKTWEVLKANEVV